MTSSLRMHATNASFFRLAGCQQPLVEVPDSRVVAGGHQGSHVEDGPHPGASAPDGAFVPPGAAVAVVGSHAHQGGDLPAIQRTQLRQIGQQSEGELLPYAGNGAEQVVLLTPHWTPAQV